MSIVTPLAAFETTIACSEGTIAVKGSDDGYNVTVGGKLFTSYRDHPRTAVWIKRIGKYSTAAGRYQILATTFDYYKKLLRLSDFSPHSQDLIATQLIRECHALDDIAAGRIETALVKCNSRWASLPGAGYGQHENKLTDLVAAYQLALTRVPTGVVA